MALLRRHEAGVNEDEEKRMKIRFIIAGCVDEIQILNRCKFAVWWNSFTFEWYGSFDKGRQIEDTTPSNGAPNLVRAKSAEF